MFPATISTHKSAMPPVMKILRRRSISMASRRWDGRGERAISKSYLRIRACRLDGEPRKQRDKARFYCRLRRIVNDDHVDSHVVVGWRRLTCLLYTSDA